MAQVSKKHKFVGNFSTDSVPADPRQVADGVFRAELGEFFMRELAEEGYSGCDVRVTHARTEVSLCLFQITVTQRSSDHHPRHPHSGSPRCQGSPHPRADRSRSKAFQVPREQSRALCRKGSVPWSLCCRSVRESPLQAPRWSRHPSVSRPRFISSTIRLKIRQSMLWCPPFRHGVWCQGM
jgi:hypothetical protein